MKPTAGSLRQVDEAVLELALGVMNGTIALDAAKKALGHAQSGTVYPRLWSAVRRAVVDGTVKVSRIGGAP